LQEVMPVAFADIIPFASHVLPAYAMQAGYQCDHHELKSTPFHITDLPGREPGQIRSRRFAASSRF
jgi:hypothetical protein